MSLRHRAWPSFLPVVHQWPAWLCYIKDQTIFRWLHSILEYTDSRKLHIKRQWDLVSLAQWESFHPDKCNMLQVTKKRTPLNSIYKLKGQELAELSTSKYLGWTFQATWTGKSTSKGQWRKWRDVLGFLRRNLRINNCETKSSAYVTLVHPYLEYCASIWSPHTGQSKQKLEMVQRRSARYCNTCSVTDMLQDLNWKTLESRRT